MTVLHILVEGAVPLATKLINEQSGEAEVEVMDLSVDKVSYDELVDRVFAADRVICWSGGESLNVQEC